METLSKKCVDIDTVGSFCDCIAREEPAEPASARGFCNRAKTDKNITGADLADLKVALMDWEDKGCCDCG
jgi:hypothetical protein